MSFKNVLECFFCKKRDNHLSLLSKKIKIDYMEAKASNEKDKQEINKLKKEFYKTQIEINQLLIKEKNRTTIEKIVDYFWTHIIASLIFISLILGGAILFFYYFAFTPNYFPDIKNISAILPWITVLVILIVTVFNFPFYIVYLLKDELGNIDNNQRLLFFIMPIYAIVSTIGIPILLENFDIKLSNKMFIVIICVNFVLIPFMLSLFYMNSNYKIKYRLIYLFYVAIVTYWFCIILMQYVNYRYGMYSEIITWAILFLIYISWLFIIYSYIKEFIEGKNRTNDYNFLMTMFIAFIFGLTIINGTMRILNIGYYNISELKIKSNSANIIKKYLPKKCKDGTNINNTIYKILEDNKSILLSNVNVLSSIGDEYYIQKTCKDKNSIENGFIIKKSEVTYRGEIRVFKNKNDKNNSKQ